MCGRYSLTSPPELLVGLFGLTPGQAIDWSPRFNIAPTQRAPVVRLTREGDGRKLVEMTWGLVPWWSEDRSIGARTINARSETAATKPAFRDAWRRRRCLVPASGFYEWRKLGRVR
ncbi:MAG: SOS response-associated peptidase, partial [Planctomycetota bacterium]